MVHRGQHVGADGKKQAGTWKDEGLLKTAKCQKCRWILGDGLDRIRGSEMWISKDSVQLEEMLGCVDNLENWQSKAAESARGRRKGREGEASQQRAAAGWMQRMQVG